MNCVLSRRSAPPILASQRSFNATQVGLANNEGGTATDFFSTPRVRLQPNNPLENTIPP